MSTHKIAVLPGDGIGPEVVKEGMKILAKLQEMNTDFSVESTTYDWNSDYYLEHGRMMPANGIETLQYFDSIYFGAIGDRRVAEHIPIWELIMPIRKQFQQYVNLRPIKQLKGVSSPLEMKSDELIDFKVFRENAEGEYSDIGGRIYNQTDQEMAIQNTVITKKGVERIGRYAFEYAKNNNLNRVVSATKSNAIVHSMKLWDDVMNDIASTFEGIELDSIYVDALAAYFVSNPHKFDVIVASNLFGDILTDLGSALVGGLGLSPSANINPERKFPSMFEPIHGSAPDIAGKGIANPIAQIWSAALMLEHFNRNDLANKVTHAIESVLEKGEVLTPDLGGNASTEELGDAVLKELED